MGLRWDSVLVRRLAEELHERLAGERVRALRLDGGTRDLVLLGRAWTLSWRLHPERGELSFHEPVAPEPADLRLNARVRAVTSPADERIVRVEMVDERRARGGLSLVVELIGNRWNALVTEGPDETVRHVLVRRSGARPAEVGSAYTPPPPTARRTDAAPEAWAASLADVPPSERARALTRGWAWTSPLNAATILGVCATDPDPALLEGAFLRWRRFAEGSDPEPVLLEEEGRLQPYPFPLVGIASRSVPSVLHGLAACADAAAARGASPAAVHVSPTLLRTLDAAVDRARRRLTRLEAERERVEDPAALRALGDLVLARFRDVPSGAESALLTGFDGRAVEVALDPSLRAHENADRYYERAARAERARERLPGLVAEAGTALAALESLRARAVDGSADADELRAALPERSAQPGRAGEEAPLPYRSFRSSGGLEIRVGRGSRHNDDLTFRHSAPGDVWLHARHAAGAHVVLRWNREGAPPARDLHEAAVHAALNSKARTSGSVPVDWTYRKYVRKPRGAPPGSVVPERVKTLFVEPDASLVGDEG